MSYYCVICSEKSALSAQNTIKFLEYLDVGNEFMEVKSLLLKRLKLPSDNTRYCFFFYLKQKMSCGCIENLHIYSRTLRRDLR